MAVTIKLYSSKSEIVILDKSEEFTKLAILTPLKLSKYVFHQNEPFKISEESWITNIDFKKISGSGSIGSGSGSGSIGSGSGSSNSLP